MKNYMNFMRTRGAGAFVLFALGIVLTAQVAHAGRRSYIDDDSDSDSARSCKEHAGAVRSSEAQLEAAMSCLLTLAGNILKDLNRIDYGATCEQGKVTTTISRVPVEGSTVEEGTFDELVLPDLVPRPMPGEEVVAHLVFEDCDFRGDGDLVNGDVYMFVRSPRSEGVSFIFGYGLAIDWDQTQVTHRFADGTLDTVTIDGPGYFVPFNNRLAFTNEFTIEVTAGGIFGTAGYVELVPGATSEDSTLNVDAIFVLGEEIDGTFNVGCEVGLECVGVGIDSTHPDPGPICATPAGCGDKCAGGRTGR